jgi:hypothetical protein
MLAQPIHSVCFYRTESHKFDDRFEFKSRRMRWAGHVARIREKRNAYRILVGKPEGKRQLGRPRHR